MITIKEFINPIEAGLVQSFLKDNEIDSFLADEHAARWTGAPILVPIRLQVSEDEAERATALIEQFDAAPLITGDEEAAASGD